MEKCSFKTKMVGDERLIDSLKSNDKSTSVGRTLSLDGALNDKDDSKPGANQLSFRPRYKFITRLNKGGKTIYFYRKPINGKKGKRIRFLESDPTSAAFRDEYYRLVTQDGALTTRDNERILLAKIAKKRIRNALARDKLLGRESDITEDWIEGKLVEQRFRCALTGIHFSAVQSGKRINPYGPSLDRINNSLGYTKDNLRVVISALNLMFNDWGEDVFYGVARAFLNRKEALRLIPHTSDGVRG